MKHEIINQFYYKKHWKRNREFKRRK